MTTAGRKGEGYQPAPGRQRGGAAIVLVIAWRLRVAEHILQPAIKDAEGDRCAGRKSP